MANCSIIDHFVTCRAFEAMPERKADQPEWPDNGRQVILMWPLTCSLWWTVIVIVKWSVEEPVSSSSGDFIAWLSIVLIARQAIDCEHSWLISCPHSVSSVVACLLWTRPGQVDGCLISARLERKWTCACACILQASACRGKLVLRYDSRDVLDTCVQAFRSANRSSLGSNCPPMPIHPMLRLSPVAVLSSGVNFAL